DHAQAGAEMPAGLAHGFDQVGAQFVGDGAQLGFGLLAQVGRAVDLRQARVTAWVDHAAIVLPAVGGGNEGRAKPGCGEGRIDAGSRRVPGTQASQPGGALREKRRPGLAGPPLVPRRGGGWCYQITTWLSASRTMASPALQPN